MLAEDAGMLWEDVGWRCLSDIVMTPSAEKLVNHSYARAITAN